MKIAMREPNFALTVTLKGVTSQGAEDNRERTQLVKRVVRTILEHPHRVVVVLFPGGYFRLADTDLGQLGFAARKRRIERASFAQQLCRSATELDSRAPGSLLVLGVDTAPKRKKGDQLCVAWGPAGVTGIGRKVFPVKGFEAQNLEISSRDFSECRRVVKLANGQRFILCACYDGFGVSCPGKRGRAIKNWLGRDGQVGRPRHAWRDELYEAQHDWKALCESVDGALIAIHQFDEGNSSMWQRHGIATASARLRGGDAFAAAHFKNRLPGCQVELLASQCVDHAHLTQGQRRCAEYARPQACHVDERGGFRLLWFRLQGPRCR